MKKYIIITPAYNEAAYVEDTIKSVIAQTVLPIVWVIVDDGSTDATDDVIKRYAQQYDWIRYCRREKEAGQTYYASNVYAIAEGLKIAKDLEYEFLAILDADITLPADYYEEIFCKFNVNPQLGIATGTYTEKEGRGWVKARIDRRSTPKAIQVFRRDCYELCGGYIPFKYGGEDSGMEIMARMNGWQTWSFENIIARHLRPVGTGDGRSLLRARYRMGITDYCLGTHPLFMIFKAVKRCVWEKPYFISGIARLLGFLSGCINKMDHQIPVKAIKYLRKEQMSRLLTLFSRNNSLWRPK